MLASATGWPKKFLDSSNRSFFAILGVALGVYDVAWPAVPGPDQITPGRRTCPPATVPFRVRGKGNPGSAKLFRRPRTHTPHYRNGPTAPSPIKSPVRCSPKGPCVCCGWLFSRDKLLSQCVTGEEKELAASEKVVFACGGGGKSVPEVIFRKTGVEMTNTAGIELFASMASEVG